MAKNVNDTKYQEIVNLATEAFNVARDRDAVMTNWSENYNPGYTTTEVRPGSINYREPSTKTTELTMTLGSKRIMIMVRDAGE